jgi:nucleoside-diphosphate-sugar epimerase
VKPETRRVAVTHADQPLGQRLVKRLCHDDAVSIIHAIGTGPRPRSFLRFVSRGNGRLRYTQVDLTRHRSVGDFFHSAPVRHDGIDTVIHLPDMGSDDDPRRPTLSRVPSRTTEARLVLQHCLEGRTIRQLIALSSAFVYRLTPGNANCLSEESELDLDPDLPAETRSWVDCDMLLHGEVYNEQLDVAVLRVPTVVAQSGALLMSPVLPAGPLPAFRALGFDPMCALVADRDVCSAIRLTMHKRRAGVFNIAGRESLPLSVLVSGAGGLSLPVPGTLLRGAATAARLFGAEGLSSALEGPHVRFGFSLDTRRAETQLGFRPGYRIGLGRGDDGQPRIEAS